MQTIRFDLAQLPPEAEALRLEVRGFLAEYGAHWTRSERARSWDGFDREFSQTIGARGWIGMTWPRQFGGGERSALERFVVLEEMLAAGAPVSAHWIADRQSGPLLLRYGSEEQKRTLLPRIALGELCFCIGLSEPDAGSDVAALHCVARESESGWVLNGTKIWTTNAQHADYMIALVRTDGEAKDRQKGLSQFLVPLSRPGVTVRPIADMTGENHFNEVVFEDVMLPSDALLGRRRAGWTQAMEELALERSGPERFLSSIQVLACLILRLEENPSEEGWENVGRLVAQLGTLRQMSLSVASMLAADGNPSLEACIVKDLGTGFEQQLPEIAHRMLGLDIGLGGDTDADNAIGHLLLMAPAFSLRGGTREILRGIIARGLGLR
ncbi:MAG: acyl-CoA dehydrogenase [Xanthobacteraceae bacterium]|nr:MAG: acyl-CoA dehydrogenase [Xanthobacteraceae bacterium]